MASLSVTMQAEVSPPAKCSYESARVTVRRDERCREHNHVYYCVILNCFVCPLGYQVGIVLKYM